MLKMNRHYKQEGAALAAVLIFGATLFLLGTTLLSYSLNEKLISDYQEDEVRLYYIAEAGLEAGLAALRRDFSYRSQIIGALGGGSFSVNFTSLAPNLVQVSSAGALGRNRKTVTLIAEQKLPASIESLSANGISLDNASIAGNVYVHGQLLARQGINRIAGNLRYKENTPPLLWPGATLEVSGSTSPAPPEPATQINIELLAGRSQRNITGDVIFSPPAGYPAQRHFLAEGDLTIAPKAEETFAFSGMIYVRGDLHIYQPAGSTLLLDGVLAAEGDVNYHPNLSDGATGSTGTLLILAGGDINLQPAAGSAGRLVGKQILYSRSSITLQGYPEEPLSIHGAVLAEQINLTFCNLFYEPTLWQAHLVNLPGLGEIRADWIR